MIRRLGLLGVSLFVTGVLLAPPAARAFTLENDPAKAAPNFDFDEQLRQFRTNPQLDTSANGSKKSWDTPIGKLQFGVQQRNVSPFSSPFAPMYGSSNSGNADRRHYDRLFAPPHRQHEYD